MSSWVIVWVSFKSIVNMWIQLSREEFIEVAVSGLREEIKTGTQTSEVCWSRTCRI